MDYVFDDATIYQGDSVHVVGIGPGKVIDTTATYFRIRAAGRTIKVSYAGVQSGHSFQSVFWANPVIAKPAKDDVLWSTKQRLALDTTNAFASAVVGQELVRAVQIAPEPVADTGGTNSARLQEMIEQAQANTRERNNVTSISG